MSFLIHIRNRRTRQYAIDLFESDGSTAVVLAADDVVRIKIGANGETPTLDLSSITPTENHSKVTFTAGTNDVVLTLAQDDVAALGVGAFDVEVAVVGNSETEPPNAIKHAESGVLFVHPVPGGEVGDEESSSSVSTSDSSGSSSPSSSV